MTFIDDAQLSVIDSSTYVATLASTWRSMLDIHGGYVAAITARAIELAIDDPARALRSLTVQFIRPAHAGDVTIAIEVTKNGRSATFLRAVVAQDERPVLTAAAVLGTSRDGLAFAEIPTPPGALKGPPPDAERFTGPEPGFHFEQLDFRLEPGLSIFGNHDRAHVSAAAAEPTAGAGRDPVVVVAGTFATEAGYDVLAHRLRTTGHDVSVFALPNRGQGDIRQSAAALGAFVDGVLARTGASDVDLVGHSQGGLVARQYIRFAGGLGRVDTSISLGTPHHGAAVANLTSSFPGCTADEACRQMAIGSAFLAVLNEGDETFGDTRYANLVTAWDQVVTPSLSGFMRDGATNVLVQQHCPLRYVGHLGLVVDGAVATGIASALAGGPIALDCWAR